MAMGDKHECKNLVQRYCFSCYAFIGIFREGYFLQKTVNFYEVNINVGDALIFDISNIK